MSPDQVRRSRLTFGGNVKRALCGLCPARCGMLVEVEDDRPVRFIGDLENPTAAGKLCIKATASLELHDHPDRVDHVLKRVGRRGDGRWEQIPWEQAMDEIAAKLGDIRDRRGSRGPRPTRRHPARIVGLGFMALRGAVGNT